MQLEISLHPLVRSQGPLKIEASAKDEKKKIRKTQATTAMKYGNLVYNANSGSDLCTMYKTMKHKLKNIIETNGL